MNNAEIERIGDLHDLALNGGGMSLSGKIPLRDMAVRLAQIVIEQAAEIERLKTELVERKRRMELLKEYSGMGYAEGQRLIDDHPEAADWFDEGRAK